MLKWVELVSIEENGQYKPDLRTVYQLANFFGVQRANLLQVAGLTAPKDSHIVRRSRSLRCPVGADGSIDR